MNTFEVGQKVALLHDSRKITVRGSGIVKRVLKTHIEVQRPDDSVEKYRLDGRDQHPRPKESFRTAWLRCEPWTEEHGDMMREQRNRSRASNLDVRKLTRRQVAELVELMAKWETEGAGG